MHGVVRGFRPRHRLQAACELIGHIARDDLRSASGTPSSLTGEGWEPALSLSKSLPRTRYGGEGDEGRNLKAGSHDQARLTGAAIQGGPAVVHRRRACPVLDTGPLSRATLPSHRRKACPVLDTGPVSRIGGDEEGLPSDHPEADDQEDPDTERGSYDIDRKIADAQQDPAHPIHKFVQAYDEVAAAFHAKDNDNDNDDEVRYWISGEVRDAYGKYIWEYAPAHPKSVPTTTPPQAQPPLEAKGRKRLGEERDRQETRGRHPAAQTHTHLGLNPPRRPTGPGGAITTPASSERRAASHLP